MPETLSTRITRLERAMTKMANAQAHLADVQARLTEAQARLADVQAQDQTEARERERRIDERIEKLVIAIGEWINRKP